MAWSGDLRKGKRASRLVPRGHPRLAVPCGWRGQGGKWVLGLVAVFLQSPLLLRNRLCAICS